MMMQAMRNRFRRTRASQPVMGMTMALLIRYDVKTQVTVGSRFGLPCMGKGNVGDDVDDLHECRD
jgi:hypothetical protein